MSEKTIPIYINKIQEEVSKYEAHIKWLEGSLNDNPSQAKRDYLKELKAEKDSLILFLKIYWRYVPDPF